MDICDLVCSLINTYRTRDPCLLCKYLGIDIRYLNLGNIKGMYKKILGVQCICVNKSLSFFIIQIVIAHELGHALLHDENTNLMKNYYLISEDNKSEREAYIFAAELLLNNLHIGDYILENKFDLLMYKKLLSFKCFN